MIRLLGIFLSSALIFLTTSCTPTKILGLEDNINETTTTAQSNFADTIFTNAAVYTVNESNPWAEAVAIQNGVIVYVGENAGANEWIGDQTEVIDLEGLMLMPGFQDPHLHAVEAGNNEQLCILSATASANQYRQELQDCAQQQSGAVWIRGAGVSMIDLLGMNESPLTIIDSAIPDRPAIIQDDLGHGAWANTLALEAVGYDQIDGHPQGGVLGRDAQGNLNGVVLENAQQKLRTASLPPNQETLEFTYQNFLGALNTLSAFGITSVSDAGGYWPRGHQDIWERAEREGTLSVRASNAFYVFPDRPFDEQVAELRRLFNDNSNSLVRFNQAKIYVDGILDLGTSALNDSYDFFLDLPGTNERGFLYFETNTLNRYSRELAEIGYQLHFHATGDRGAGLALDAIAQAQGAGDDARHRITHLYLIDESDRQRFKDLAVVADFQLAPGSTDLGYANLIGEIIGTRSNDLLPAASILETGATVVLSSDWDADSLSPFEKIESVMTRSSEGISDLSTVVRMMTLDVAFLLHQEDLTGSIEVNKMADLIVLDRNLFDIPVSQIDRASVLLTMLQGEVVFQDASF